MLFHIKILQTVIKRHKSIKSALKLGKHLNTTHNSFRKHLHELGKCVNGSSIKIWLNLVNESSIKMCLNNVSKCVCYMNASQLNQRVALCSSL